MHACKFAPHVTLARLGHVRLRDVGQFMVQSGGFSPLTLTANGFALFSARNSTSGGPYLAEEEFRF